MNWPEDADDAYLLDLAMTLLIERASPGHFARLAAMMARVETKLTAFERAHGMRWDDVAGLVPLAADG